jgi:protein-S-isoprenylcysteine O-methyltransferase Ste14
MTLPAQVAPGHAILAAWVVWLLSWLAAAVWTRQTVARPSYAREFPNRFVTLVGGLVLSFTLSSPRTLFPHWTPSEAFGWTMFAGVIAGIAFAWWARLHLGVLWSGTITRKEGHRIVDSGPYAIVRHPIYTGILFALFATAIASGRVEPMLGAAIISVGLWMKAKLEEGFLAQELGAGYAAYCARVPMLIPFAKGGRA